MTEDAWRLLEARRYEGNVRELRSLLLRMASLSEAHQTTTIDGEIAREILGAAPPSADAVVDDLARYFSVKRAPLAGIKKARRRYVEEILARNGGNITQTARECGAPRTTVRRILKGTD